MLQEYGGGSNTQVGPSAQERDQALGNLTREERAAKAAQAAGNLPEMASGAVGEPTGDFDRPIDVEEVDALFDEN